MSNVHGAHDRRKMDVRSALNGISDMLLSEANKIMSAAVTQAQAERAELEAILSSGIFSRSPILATFLRYICERHFEGDTDGLKEYRIAIEALKRPPDFDQKKDAIVRVEAHRLRKRLAEYYQKEGADHSVQIEIPNGQYAPRFVSKNAEVPSAARAKVAEFTADVVSSPENETAANKESDSGPAKSGLGRWIIWGSAGAAAVVVSILFLARSSGLPKTLPAKTAPEVWQGALSPVPIDFRMLAGYHGLPFVDRQGRMWSPDAYYKGGVSVSVPNHRSLQGLPDPDFAPSQRTGDFEYSIPVSPGAYQVQLHFVETQIDEADGPGAKLFNVWVNGKLALDHIDPLSDAGAPRRLTTRILSNVAAAADGRIHLKFEQQGTKPELVGLEILATPPGEVRPLRIVAASHSVTDAEGTPWLADECAVGGTLIERKDIVQESALKNIYAGERYGNFAYHLPLPPGKYRIKLYFAESYFSDRFPPGTNQNGFGARIFNVFADGVTLLRNFNVMKEAGGSHRAVIRTFENLQPDAQGKIVLEFVPVMNYAEVNAIEVTQMN